MRLILLSDTHSLHKNMTHPIPDGDVLVHCGDFTGVGELRDVLGFNDWLGGLPHEHKVVIAGNHERGWTQGNLEGVLTNATYLQDSLINIRGVNFYGSPWTPNFGWGWAFNARRGEEIRGHWGRIPRGQVDVLITHGPPMGILDRVGFESVGCADLRTRVADVAPTLHVFGHLHEGYGQTKIGQTTYVNAAICNEMYEPINAPIVLDI
jgi:hypothetical protein